MPNKMIRADANLSAAPKRLDPAARRAQLLEHAMAAFADAGIERAVHADVAIRAEVSTPTVFKYFPTREALVDAVLGEVEQTLESLQSHLEPNKVFPPAELTRAMADILSVLCVSRPDMMKVMLIWSVAFSPVRVRYLSFETRLQKILTSLLDSDATDKSDPLILLATAKLFIRMHFDDSTAEDRNDYINRMCEILAATQTASPS